ncbi:DNA-J related domain-containing protein [Alteromonas flava]|uniref:DNA-J related domain-containing protein n=1 Tax=Alteromonas flava TaxID=2048003 RepID=UPI0013D93DA4|nr:DNA-J related domain-containing protein [Alteromonas flava]
MPTARENNHIEAIMDALDSLRPELRLGISEFDLLQRLMEAPYALFKPDALQGSLALFQSHFILFHCLYRMRQEWRALHVGELQIHTTNIQLQPYQPPKAALTQSDKLQEYYLDWAHFASTSGADVDELLEQFWLQFGTTTNATIEPQALTESLTVMGLEESAASDLVTVKQCYKRLLHQHHPDKGGDAAHAQRIVAAYRTLRRYAQQNNG